MNLFLEFYFISPVVVFFYQQRGLDYFQILSLESILVLFIFLFEVPTGIFADRYGKRTAIILGVALRFIQLVIFLFAKNFFLFAFSFALYGISITLFSGTLEALIYDYLKQKNDVNLMKEAMGNYGFFGFIPAVIAPVVGSFIAKDLSSDQFKILIFMSITTTIIGLIISFFIEKSDDHAPDKNPFTILKKGVKIIRENRSLLRIVWLSIFTNPFAFVIMYLVQPYFKISGVNIALFGAIMAAAHLLSGISQKYAYTVEKVFGIKWGTLLVTCLPAFIYLMMAFIFHPIFSVILFWILEFIIWIRIPIFSDYKNGHIPDEIRSTVLSVISLLGSFYMVIMRLIIGGIAEFKLSYAFIFMGIVIIIPSLLLRIEGEHVHQNLKSTEKIF
jgi:MFS family permease